jgi:hypothetical protein
MSRIAGAPVALFMLGAIAAAGCGTAGVGKKSSASAPAPAPTGPTFTEVDAMLADNCGGCHSAGAKAPRVQFVGNQDVLRQVGAEVVRRITSTDPIVVMPPPRYHAPLSADDQAMVSKFLGS